MVPECSGVTDWGKKNGIESSRENDRHKTSKHRFSPDWFVVDGTLKCEKVGRQMNRKTSGD